MYPDPSHSLPPCPVTPQIVAAFSFPRKSLSAQSSPGLGPQNKQWLQGVSWPPGRPTPGSSGEALKQGVGNGPAFA